MGRRHKRKRTKPTLRRQKLRKGEHSLVWELNHHSAYITSAPIYFIEALIRRKVPQAGCADLQDDNCFLRVSGRGFSG